MYCRKCGKENPQDSVFCKYCGLKFRNDSLGEVAISQEPVATSAPKRENKKSAWQSIASFGALVVAWAVGRALGLVFFLLVVGWLVGYWFAKWFIKNHPNSKFFSIVAWLNVISWLSPVLGFLTAGVTYVFAEHKKQTKYYVLLIIATILAVGNALLYPYATNPNNTGLGDFKTSYRSSFIDSCSKSSGAEGLQYCSCMADYLIKNYSEAQLTVFSAQYKVSGQAPQAIQDAISSCISTNSNFGQ